MARVNWNGHEIEAAFLNQLPNGNWRMRAWSHAPRVEPGTIIEVKPHEIVDPPPAAGSPPAAPAEPAGGGPAAPAPAPDAALDAPLAGAPDVRSPLAADAVSRVPLGPSALDAATAEHVISQVDRVLDASVKTQNREASKMSKLAAIADRIRTKKATHDKIADDFASRLDALDKREPDALAVADAVMSAREHDLTQFEDDMRQLSNLGN